MQDLGFLVSPKLFRNEQLMLVFLFTLHIGAIFINYSFCYMMQSSVLRPPGRLFASKSAEWKSKISESIAKKWKDPEYVEKIRAAKQKIQPKVTRQFKKKVPVSTPDSPVEDWNSSETERSKLMEAIRRNRLKLAIEFCQKSGNGSTGAVSTVLQLQNILGKEIWHEIKVSIILCSTRLFFLSGLMYHCFF